MMHKNPMKTISNQNVFAIARNNNGSFLFVHSTFQFLSWEEMTFFLHWAMNWLVNYLCLFFSKNSVMLHFCFFQIFLMICNFFNKKSWHFTTVCVLPFKAIAKGTGMICFEWFTHIFSIQYFIEFKKWCRPSKK